MMEIDPPSKFASKEEEVNYWMAMAHEMYSRNKDIEHELEDYHESSIILEKELETSFQQTDQRNRNLCMENSRLMADNEEYRARLSQNYAASAAMQLQMQELEENCKNLRINVRELERENDVLERTIRENKMTEEERESKFDILIEKLALIETDLEEKEDMRATIQRLKDENKELRQQLEVERRSLRANEKSDALNESACGTSRTSLRSLRANNRESSRYSLQYEWNQLQNMNSVTERVRTLERNIECLNKSTRLGQLAEEDKRATRDEAIGQVAQLEAELRSRNLHRENQQQPQRAKSDLTQEVQLRVRANPRIANKEKSMTLGAGDAKPRARSYSNRFQQEEEDTSIGSRGVMSGQIEKRVKKVKEEEKRQQNLSSWLKKIRDAHPNWLRRK